MQNHHETERLSLRDLAGLVAANLTAIAALVYGAMNVPELLMLAIG